MTKIPNIKLDMWANVVLPPYPTEDNWDSYLHQLYVIQDLARELLETRKELEELKTHINWLRGGNRLYES